MSHRPSVALGALGGTIAMTPSDTSKAVTPQMSAADLIAAVPGLADIADIRATSLSNLASPAMTMTEVLAALRFARAAIADGARGIVLTHGTDTLEEAAFLLDLLWDQPEPLVITGAMRSPSQPSADGPANLIAAIRAAISPDLRGCGVLVAFNDEIHLARAVTKSHSTSLSTFRSPDWGPIARVAEGHVTVMLNPAKRLDPLPVPPPSDVSIPIVEVGLAEGGSYLPALAATGIDALIVAASGVGHMSPAAADHCEDLVAGGLPVIFATKTGAGRTLEGTYGYPGSETDLLSRGLIGAGSLSPRKARLLTHVLVRAGRSRDQMRGEFLRRG